MAKVITYIKNVDGTFKRSEVTTIDTDGIIGAAKEVDIDKEIAIHQAYIAELQAEKAILVSARKP